MRDSFEASRDSLEVGGKGPLNTQPNGNRTAIGVLFRSDAKYSNGRIDWNTS